MRHLKNLLAKVDQNFFKRSTLVSVRCFVIIPNYQLFNVWTRHGQDWNLRCKTGIIWWTNKKSCSKLVKGWSSQILKNCKLIHSTICKWDFQNWSRLLKTKISYCSVPPGVIFCHRSPISPMLGLNLWNVLIFLAKVFKKSFFSITKLSKNP